MTQEQCVEKAWEMFTSPDFQDAVKNEITQLAKSGAIDLDREPSESYAMPKVILTAALERSAHDYAPLYEPYRKELKNLRRF